MSAYYDRPEWSYSQMKVILDSGIDYAVAAKQGLIAPPTGAQLDLGRLIHAKVLGTEQDEFVESPFPSFRTKEAREWKSEQEQAGRTIIDQSQSEIAEAVAKNVVQHPRALELILSNGCKHEAELYATAEGVKLRGKADSLLSDGQTLIITDIKTTARFDDFKRTACYRHYDLQAAVYSLIGANALKVDRAFTNYWFCVCETVAPFRVQFFHSSREFLENGETKLGRCLKEINDFGDKEPCFLLDDDELGDWSL